MGSARGPWTTRSAGSSPAVDGRRFGFRRRRRHRREAPGHFHLWNSLCAVNPSAFQEGSAYILGENRAGMSTRGAARAPAGGTPKRGCSQSDRAQSVVGRGDHWTHLENQRERRRAQGLGGKEASQGDTGHGRQAKDTLAWGASSCDLTVESCCRSGHSATTRK